MALSHQRHHRFMDCEAQVIHSHEKQTWMAHPTTQGSRLRIDTRGTACDAPPKLIHVMDMSTIHRYLEMSVLQRYSDQETPRPDSPATFTSGTGTGRVSDALPIHIQHLPGNLPDFH
jgi:hypothetical protein